MLAQDDAFALGDAAQRCRCLTLLSGDHRQCLLQKRLVLLREPDGHFVHVGCFEFSSLPAAANILLRPEVRLALVNDRADHVEFAGGAWASITCCSQVEEAQVMIYVDIQLLWEAMGACRDFCTVVLAERALGLNTDQSRARALREIPGTSTILTLERDGEVIDITLLDKRLVGLDARASKLQSHAVSMPGGVIRVYFDLSSRLVESHHGWRLVRD